MKRLFPVAIALTTIILFASCDKKDYTCHCKMTKGPDQSFWLGKMNNNAAQKMCVEQQEALTKASTGIVGSCKVIY